MLKKISLLLLVMASFGAHADLLKKHGIWISQLRVRADASDIKIQNIENQIAAINASKITRYLGEMYRGGVIFWLDETKQHGLIATKTDINQGKGIQWRNGDSGNKVTNARADGIRAGEGNTRLIIAQQTIDYQSGTFAALLAANYRVLEDGETPCPIPVPISMTCYGGWYLPSAHELALIQHNLNQQGITTFAPDFYWSSTEASSTKAWIQNFSTGEQIASDKSSTLGQVRAVSRF